ncbi:hypothetical protein [Xylanibacillus composti]|uniref:Uncharacterized protein n=1 Tax=Xylanibacillus composti TaxID=1572762 RepID=A0A8J4H7Y1_9BACL|nr:hypothetical protein [Xylanibacillus composti]GIQ70508.1 hypothetical protein XYCOK13_33320 [Xylanibacillus composti]
MVWLRLTIIAMFSVSVISLLGYQAVEITNAVMDLIKSYKK